MAASRRHSGFDTILGGHPMLACETVDFLEEVQVRLGSLRHVIACVSVAVDEAI